MEPAVSCRAALAPTCLCAALRVRLHYRTRTQTPLPLPIHNRLSLSAHESARSTANAAVDASPRTADGTGCVALLVQVSSRQFRILQGGSAFSQRCVCQGQPAFCHSGVPPNDSVIVVLAIAVLVQLSRQPEPADEAVQHQHAQRGPAEHERLYVEPPVRRHLLSASESPAQSTLRCAALRATVWGGTIMGTSIEECDEAVPGVPVTGGSSTDLPRTETVAVSLCQRPRAERSRQARRAEVAASARSGGGCGGGRAGGLAR